MKPQEYSDSALLELIREATKIETTAATQSEINRPRERLTYAIRQRFAAGVNLTGGFEACLSGEELKTLHRALSFVTDYRVELAGGQSRVWKLFALSLRVEALHTLSYTPFLTRDAHTGVMQFLKDAGEETDTVVLAMQAVPYVNLDAMNRLERSRLLDAVRQGRLPESLQEISPSIPMRSSAPFLVIGAMHTAILKPQDTDPRSLWVQRFQLAARNGLPVAEAAISGPPARFSKVLRNAGINYIGACVGNAVRTGNAHGLSIRIPGLWLETDQAKRVRADIEGDGINESLSFQVEPYDIPAMRAHARKIATEMMVRLVEPN